MDTMHVNVKSNRQQVLHNGSKHLEIRSCGYMCVSVSIHTLHSLGCILAQLLVPHEELLSLPECLANGVALVDRLNGCCGDFLDGCYGQSAMLQHELSHLAVSPQQSIVQRRVPTPHKHLSDSWIHFPSLLPPPHVCRLEPWLTSPQCAPCG